MIKNNKGQFLVSTRPVQWGTLEDALNISESHAVGLIRKLNADGIEASWLNESEKPEALGHNSNLTIFGRELIDEGAISQMYDAMRIAPAVQGALMSDSHKGYFLPIGGVLALENAVHPFAVGVDIACRIRLNTFDFPVDDLTDSNVASLFEVLKSVTAFGVGACFSDPHIRDHDVMFDPLWDSSPILKGLKHKARTQLGSSGGGNHHANLVRVDYLDGRSKFGLQTHSGSRATGMAVANYFTALADKETSSRYSGLPKNFGWLSLDTDAGKDYWQHMELMGRYAAANHEIIAREFMRDLGWINCDFIDHHHNFAWRENGLIVHRKGATPAHKNQMGIIAGTSGTKSYLTEGLGNFLSLESSSHGAGRVSSRKKAKEMFNESKFVKQMSNIIYSGIAPDEGFESYKDIERVIQIQEDAGLLKVVASIQPLAVIMGGAESDDGD